MNLNLKDKVVIVTGGAAGIGRATVEGFEAEGARVVVWDLPEVNVTDANAVGQATEDVLAKHGRIDVLVNNAGIVRDSQLVKWKDGDVVSQMDDATFDAVVNVNLKGVFLCTRAVVPHMIRNGGGSVLNASSIVGLYGNFGQTNYAATKAASSENSTSASIASHRASSPRTWSRPCRRKCSTPWPAGPRSPSSASPPTSPTRTYGWPAKPRNSCTAPCCRWTAGW